MLSLNSPGVPQGTADDPPSEACVRISKKAQDWRVPVRMVRTSKVCAVEEGRDMVLRHPSPTDRHGVSFLCELFRRTLATLQWNRASIRANEVSGHLPTASQVCLPHSQLRRCTAVDRQIALHEMIVRCRYSSTQHHLTR